ncbi:MAG TPA: response regulator [Chloroflexota bacterium]|jgi:DNA-binding response OmpR family regulator|nr:response regulator [Chloroflexota bacterium]
MRSALVVEDDVSIQHLIAELLHEQGFDRVFSAAGPNRARTIALEEPLDLVVLDCLLGGVSGVEVAEQLRAIPGFKAPVLVTTALPEKEAKAVCAEADACECVQKPFDITEFLRAVQNCVDGQTATAA